MFVRLRDNWVYGGFLAAFMLLALTPVLAGGWSLPLLLIWLQLPIYMLHQFEEHDDDRFRKFVNATIGGGRELLSRFDVFVINIVGVWGVDTIAIWLAARVHLGLGLIAVYLSMVNALAHCGQAVAMRRYNPGLITAIVLFIPLGVATLWVLARTGAVTTTDHVI
ncbi:MAG: HXXEE domain-containing protein, partial [Amaricoccus sp.]|uniref:HXXEE domain-containing protein n=1 Tax=Amaricoccus sp. TaxID=1872485 RepID=UPI003314F47F